MKNIFFLILTMAFMVSCNSSKAVLKEGEWRGKGANPFWTLDIKQKDITFTFVGGSSYTFPYTEPVKSGDRLVFVANNNEEGEEHWIKIVLTEESCQSSAVSEKMPYKVQITLDQKEMYFGCGTNE